MPRAALIRSPPPPLPPPDIPTAGPAPSFLFLAFTAGQAACEAATPRRDLSGKFVGWQIAQQRPTIARTAADTVMVNLQLIRFAKGTRLQTDFVNCMLPNNDASRAFMRDYFKSATRPPGIGLGIVAASVMEFLSCYWDGNGWNCGHGMYCQSSWNGLRAGPPVGPINAAPSSNGDEIGTFACTGAGSDGCWIDVQDYGSGTYYHTWGGTCDEPEEEPDGGGGGGGPTACLAWDPTCIRSLTNNEVVLVATALGRFKPLEAMDPADYALWQPLQAQVVAWFNSGAIKAGKSNALTSFITDHTANLFQGNVHLDEAILLAAANPSASNPYLDGIAIALLHEAQHKTSGASHPAERDIAGNYTDAPFDALPMVGGNPCSNRFSSGPI